LGGRNAGPCFWRIPGSPGWSAPIPGTFSWAQSPFGVPGTVKARCPVGFLGQFVRPDDGGCFPASREAGFAPKRWGYSGPPGGPPGWGLARPRISCAGKDSWGAETSSFSSTRRERGFRLEQRTLRNEAAVVPDSGSSTGSWGGGRPWPVVSSADFGRAHGGATTPVGAALRSRRAWGSGRGGGGRGLHVAGRVGARWTPRGRRIPWGAPSFSRGTPKSALPNSGPGGKARRPPRV